MWQKIWLKIKQSWKDEPAINVKYKLDEKIVMGICGAWVLFNFVEGAINISDTNKLNLYSVGILLGLVVILITSLLATQRELREIMKKK